MTDINLNLSLEEINGLIVALGELPSKTGALNLIIKIQAQVKSQLPAEPTPEEPKKESE